MKKIKTGLKIFIFVVVAAVLFTGANFLLRPVWADTTNTGANAYDTVKGFYEEPDNTIETIFLGTSVVLHGITPTELYENYGICSYNLATNAQPVMASYYLLEEAYRFQSETLDTVVFDVSEMKWEKSRKDSGYEAYYVHAFEYMKPSKVKYHFIKDFSDDFTQFVTYSIPLMSFHDRWKELSVKDFSEYQYDLETGVRGYGFRTGIALEDASSYSDISVPLYMVEDQTEVETNEENLIYFQRIVEFCNDHDLNLVLIKTPQRGTNSWSDAAHNKVQSLADQYQLDFFDFNYSPYFEELDFNFATDSYDSIHLNFYGASKITDWLGNYLIETCGNKDVRGEEEYAFMEEEVEDYHRETIFSDLNKITDPADYLSYVLEKEDYAVFISVKDDACDSLTEEQREKFESMGLIELSQLSSHASYLAVIDNGQVITEQMQAQDQEFIDLVDADETGEKTLYISYEGKLSKNTAYTMESGGYHMGNVSSIKIDGTEYSPNKRGLNIVVYDKRNKKVVDQASFDTYASPERSKLNNEESLEEAIQDGGTGSLTGKLRQLYLYDRLCEDTKTVKALKQDEGENNLSSYLQAFWDNEEYDIYLVSNGNIAEALNDSERKILTDMGLMDLSEIEEGDSYLAVIRGGDIATEQRGSDGEKIQDSGEIYMLCSGEECSLMLRGTEYAGKTKGLNIVIYDNILNRVVDSTVYNTNRVFVSD